MKPQLEFSASKSSPIRQGEWLACSQTTQSQRRCATRYLFCVLAGLVGTIRLSKPRQEIADRPGQPDPVARNAGLRSPDLGHGLSTMTEASCSTRPRIRSSAELMPGVVRATSDAVRALASARSLGDQSVMRRCRFLVSDQHVLSDPQEFSSPAAPNRNRCQIRPPMASSMLGDSAHERRRVPGILDPSSHCPTVPPHGQPMRLASGETLRQIVRQVLKSRAT